VTLSDQDSNQTRTKLFKLVPDRPCFSLWLRLAVRNMQGVVIYRMKSHHATLAATYTWQLEIPEGKGYRSTGISDSSKGRSWATGIDLNIENLVRDGKPVIIHIHQFRNNLDLYDVTVDGVGIARATRFKAEPKSQLSSWQIEIAEGFDLALVCCDRPTATRYW
jgi:hypothetical protein